MAEEGRECGGRGCSVHECAKGGYTATELEVDRDVIAEGVNLDGWDEKLQNRNSLV